MGNNILIPAVLHQETSWYYAQPRKSQFLVQMKGGFICFDHGVKLKDAKAQLPSVLTSAALLPVFPDIPGTG